MEDAAAGVDLVLGRANGTIPMTTNLAGNAQRFLIFAANVARCTLNAVRCNVLLTSSSTLTLSAIPIAIAIAIAIVTATAPATATATLLCSVLWCLHRFWSNYVA